MKRGRSSLAGTIAWNNSSSQMNPDGERIRARVAVVDESSTEVLPGVVLIDGCEVGESSTTRRCNVSAGMAMLCLNEARSKETRRGVDINDIFPDEILLQIMKYNWSPENCWDMAKVCKRWYILQAFNQLQKRSDGVSAYNLCASKQRARIEGWGLRPCGGVCKPLKLKTVDSEWRLAMDLMKTCKRHTHALEIKDCTHVSMRGYQLISGFASNLKSIRLEACTSMDDVSFDIILDKCHKLRSLHLCMVPKLSLKDLEKKACKLQELQVYGCRFITGTSVLALLTGCPNLKILSLSAMGVSADWDECKIGQGPPLRLRSLELSNTLAVNDRFLRDVSERLSQLRKLNLSNCALVSDDGLKAIIASCGSGLQKLVVTRCPRISDDGVRALAGVARNLQDLSLAGTDLSDDGLEALMKSKGILSNLRNLSLACCQRLTDSGLQLIVSRRKKLRSFKALDVQKCTQVSAFALEKLNRNSWPKIINGKNSGL